MRNHGKKKDILLGAHVSAANGLDKAIDRAEAINANCIQIFTKSNRQWKAKEITKETINLLLAKQKKSNVQVIVAHAAYLINLGSQNDEVVTKSIQSLAQELQRCEQLHIPFLVLHPGSTRFDNDIPQSLHFIAQNINTALTESKTQHVTLLVETMAGQGKNLGYTFEQLATILQHVEQKNRIGVCFDTCHAFVAGYKFDTPENYLALWKHFDQTIGLSKLKVFHINDSKKEYKSRVDRHEHIGQGKIPQTSFQFIMQDKQFKHIPKILETPKENETDDIKNIETLKKLL